MSDKKKKSNVLFLNLKSIYYNQIKEGSKTEEFREFKPYWSQRLLNRDYNAICIRDAYRAGDENTMWFKYNGYKVITKTHEIFGPEPALVYAIDVSDRMKQTTKALEAKECKQ